MNVPESPVSWAVILANNLSDEECEILMDPGVPGSRNRKSVARIIQALVEEGTKAIKKPRSSKPGPKPRKKTNQTDDDIASLWNQIRMILKLPSRTTIPSIFTKIDSILLHTQSFIEKHLLLTTDEAIQVRYYLSTWDASPSNSDLSEENESLSERIKELHPQSLLSWAKTNEAQKKATGGHALNSKNSQSQEQIFISLARSMDLHKAPLIEDNKVTIYTNHYDESFMIFPDFLSLYEIRLSRKAVLSNVIKRIIHLETILPKFSSIWSPVDAEHLLNVIDFRITTANKSKNDSSFNKFLTQYVSLKKIIVSASTRQGISPFSSFLPAFCYNPFPAILSPSQPPPVSGGRFVSDDGHPASKTPPVGRKRRQKSQVQ